MYTSFHVIYPIHKVFKVCGSLRLTQDFIEPDYTDCCCCSPILLDSYLYVIVQTVYFHGKEISVIRFCKILSDTFVYQKQKPYRESVYIVYKCLTY